MSKRRAGKRARRASGPLPRRGKIKASVVALLLSITAAGVVAAQWRSLKRAPAPAALTAAAVAQSPSGFAPDRPSKEYVYAGSRLLATEEPAVRSEQTITFDAVADKTYGDAPFTLNAAATSQLAVSFFVVSGPATVSGNVLTITGAGPVTVRAEQAGSDSFNPAPSVTRSFNVAKANQTVSFDAAQLAGKTYGDSPFAVNASSSAGLPVTITAAGGASVSGNTVTINAAGPASVKATAAGDANHHAAADVEHAFTVAKRSATVTLGGLSQTYDGAGKSATATTSPAGLAVALSYTQNGSAVASPADAGSYNVTATVSDANHTGSASGTLVINKAQATLSLGSLTQTYDGSPRVVSVSTSPAGLGGVSVAYNGSAGAPTNAGSYAVVASLSHANYTAADASGTLVINKATPSITWANPADINHGTPLGPTQLNAAASHPGGLLAGTFAYTPGAGSVLGVGSNQTLSTTFTPADAINFNGGSATARVNVLPAAPRSLALNGTTARVEVPSSSSLNLTSAFTAEAWVRVDSSASVQSIFERYGAPDASGNNGGFILRLENGRIRFFVLRSSQAGLTLLGGTAMAAGVWHHVAAVCDGAQLRVYLDGRLDGTLSPGFGYAPATGTAPLYIGSGNWGGGFFGGLIDEARVSAGALYASNFTPEASLTAGPDVRGLWKLDGPTLNDFSGNSNTGTPVGGATFSNEIPVNARSLSLNGTTAYAEVANSASVNLTTAFTAEAWIRTDSGASLQSVFERFGPSGTNGGFILRIENNKLKFFVLQSAQAGYILSGNTVVTPNVWHHVAAVADGSQMRLYLDGVLDGSLNAGALPATGSTPLYIGRGVPDATPRYFSGLIDEARVSAGALYASNFTPDTRLTAGANTRGLWRFDGESAQDSSANSNHASPSGGATYSPAVP